MWADLKAILRFCAKEETRGGKKKGKKGKESKTQCSEIWRSTVEKGNVPERPPL